MRRRQFIGGVVAIPIVGLVRPETLPIRRAEFEEVGNSVLLTLSVPGLVRRTDRQALSNIESGFTTTLDFSLKVWELRSRKQVSTRRVLVKIKRDPWKKKYVVSTQTDKGWVKRMFAKRDQAIAEATKLDRIRIASVDRLQRGADGPYYFVSVLALRNPIKDDARRSAAGRGRDVEVFDRLVELFAGERAKAEHTIALRTNAFFLAPP